MRRTVHISARRVALAVTASDAFSGEMLATARWRAAVDGAPPAMQKGGLYYIFMEIPPSPVLLRIEAAGYDAERLRIEADSLPVSLPLYQAQLRPAVDYVLPAHTTVLRGTARPGSWVYLSCPGQAEEALLLEDYRRGDTELRLAFSRPGDRRGKLYSICGRDGSGEALFVLAGAGARAGSYVLRRSLTKDYSRAASRVTRAFAARADERGAYFLPLAIPVGADGAPFALRCGAMDAPPVPVRLEIGRENVLDVQAAAQERTEGL